MQGEEKKQPKKAPTNKPEEKKPKVTELLWFESSPHMRSTEDVPKIMRGVVWALIPAALAGIYFFGLHALKVIIISIIGCLVAEYVCFKIFKNWGGLGDWSAIVTGLLLALNLPSTSPWWLILAGALVTMVLGKHVYGGLGYNPFNPALVGRVFLLIAWPAQMTTWAKPEPLFGMKLDAVTGATPLGVLKTELTTYQMIKTANQISYADLFWGKIGGSIGEISAFALLIGAIYLFARKIIRWHIPVSFVGSVLVITAIFWLIDPSKYINPIFHLLSGGLFLGAFFMATDMVTTPVTPLGMIIFGVGCGALTSIIRLFGGYPEGVSFSILIMNAFTPLLDYYTRPKTLGAK
jgi:electron transport complex protein RnfD